MLHIVDISRDWEDAIQSFEKINKELASYKLDLTDRPMIVALNKVDMCLDREAIDRFEEKYKDKYEIFEISTYTHQNIDKLCTK